MAGAVDRRDRAAKIEGRLAAGMGSGIALSRIAAGQMGQTRLAGQRRSVAAQPGRVCGCAVVAAEKVGGGNVSRPALRRENAAEEQGLHRRGRAHARARHRGERRVIQRDGRGDAEDAPGPRSRTTCSIPLAGNRRMVQKLHRVGLKRPRDGVEGHKFDVLPGLRAIPRSESNDVLGLRFWGAGIVEPERGRAGGGGERAGRFRKLLFRAWDIRRLGGSGPRAHDRRR